MGAAAGVVTGSVRRDWRTPARSARPPPWRRPRCPAPSVAASSPSVTGAVSSSVAAGCGWAGAVAGAVAAAAVAGATWRGGGQQRAVGDERQRVVRGLDELADPAEVDIGLHRGDRPLDPVLHVEDRSVGLPQEPGQAAPLGQRGTRGEVHAGVAGRVVRRHVRTDGVELAAQPQVAGPGALHRRRHHPRPHRVGIDVGVRHPHQPGGTQLAGDRERPDRNELSGPVDEVHGRAARRCHQRPGPQLQWSHRQSGRPAAGPSPGSADSDPRR